jgi:hypothetical protein
MPLFLLRYLGPGGCRVESFTVIEARDSVLARRAAQALGIAAPGAALAGGATLVPNLDYVGTATR